MEGRLQPEIEQFIYNYIDSLEKLEVLLLLFQSPEKWWTVQGIYDVIKSNPTSIHRRLDVLVGQGLAVADPEGKNCYRFQNSNPALAEVVARLSAAYTERRLRVIEAIFSKPSPSIRNFADAFRLRKDGQDG